MSRLPRQLQPLWPAVKVGHRVGARVLGGVGRRTGGPARGLPVRAGTSAAIAAAEGAPYHVVHEARVDVRERPIGAPSPHWYFEDHLRAPVPEVSVVELAGGRVLGKHAAVVSAGGTLDLDASHYFGIAGWKEHPVHWAPRPAEPREVDGTVAVLAARGTGHNYYHFLIDALPRLGMVEQALPGLQPDHWVLDHHTRYQRELVALLGIDEQRIIEPVGGLSLRARRLVVPSLPNASTLVTRETADWLRAHLPASAGATDLPERIYVTRGQAPNTRSLVHEDAVWAMLEPHGFVRVDPGTLPVQQQIDHFAAARVVVAPHGAALVNLVFSRPGVRVLEMFAPGYLNGGYWSIVDGIDDSRYRYLVGGGTAVPRGRPMRGLMDDVDVTPAQVEAELERLLAD